MIQKKTVVLAALLILSACAGRTKGPRLGVVSIDKPIRLELKPVVGAGDRTEYKSRVVTKLYENGEISRRIEESVDFTIDTKVTKVEDATKVGTYQLTTVAKDGKTDLADFALPELGETLDYVLAPDGNVVRVGDFPRGTIYYIAPVSLPKEAVEVGDSWELHAEWTSAKSGIPLRMDIVSILKSVRDCGAAGLCAEIELSGDLGLIGVPHSVMNTPVANVPTDALLRFRSEIRGRLVLSLNRGAVLYSVIRSDENMNGMKDSMQTSSCMITFVTDPAAEKIVNEKPDCQPDGDLPTL